MEKLIDDKKITTEEGIYSIIKEERDVLLEPIMLERKNRNTINFGLETENNMKKYLNIPRPKNNMKDTKDKEKFS